MKETKKNCLILLFLMMGLFTLFGCQTRLGDFTVLTTKNIDLANFTASDSDRPQVVGEDVKHIIFIFPTGVPSMKEAVDRALDSTNASLLTNAKLYYEWLYIPYIYGYHKYTVKGNPVERSN